MNAMRAAWRAVDRRIVDVVPALALFTLLVCELALRPPETGESPTAPVAYLWAALVTLPIALHRRWPVPVVLVVGVAIVGYGLGYWIGFPGYAAFAVVFLVGLHSRRPVALFGFAWITLALCVAIAVQREGTATNSTWIVCILGLTVALLAGENMRSRQLRLEALQERAVRLETQQQERARQAVTEERLRIARELHDVVAHSMSVIAVQAGVANHVIDSRPELARAALATVETNTRSALVEMRRLLGVLRQGDEPSASLTPTPGLGEVDRLVEQLAEVGLRVRVRTDGVPEDMPDGVDLSAFRIVQEGLTNVLRHGGPTADVVIGHEPGLVRITVGDDGRPPGTPPTGVRGPGHGLLGMRERVAVFGGTFTAGPQPGGGFALRATLPWAVAARGQVAQTVGEAA
jgi:signal transduction histidine kinase